MSSCKKTIRFTAIASIILLTLTYLIAVNNEIHFISCNSPWMPNSFLLSFFGGAFASMTVVLLCEISKYWQAKRGAETYLFSHFYYLYGQLQILSHSINGFLSNNGENVPRNALSTTIANAEAEMNGLYFAEYAPFCKRNSVLTEKLRYNSEVYSELQSFLQNCRALDIAVIQDEIFCLEVKMGKRGIQDNPNYTLRTLERLSKQIFKPLEEVDAIASKIDTLCDGRFKWEDTKKELLQRWPNSQNDALKQLLEEDNNIS